MNAYYELYWYELDQPIEIRQEDEFWFFKNSSPIKFYNGLFEEENAELKKCLVESIEHKKLGHIKKVDTKGLDYTLTLANGKELIINAEEEPGAIAESNLQVQNWSFKVKITIKPTELENR